MCFALVLHVVTLTGLLRSQYHSSPLAHHNILITSERMRAVDDGETLDAQRFNCNCFKNVSRISICIVAMPSKRICSLVRLCRLMFNLPLPHVGNISGIAAVTHMCALCGLCRCRNWRAPGICAVLSSCLDNAISDSADIPPAWQGPGDSARGHKLGDPQSNILTDVLFLTCIRRNT